MITIKELWVYPVKACRGIQVNSASLTPTGLKHDRSWCVVDLEGTHAPKMEAISQRRMPCLATISVRFLDDTNDEILCLDANGMQQLCLPTSLEKIKDHDAPVLTVECAGATAGGTWSLGSLQCKQHMQGSQWINNYLNQEVDSEKGRFVNGKKVKGKFALVRCCSVVELSSYPPIFPLIQRAKTDPTYKIRFEDNVKQASDFSPFLLLSQASARSLAEHCQVDKYPTTSFRGNIIVDGDALEPWAEESWSTLEINSSSPERRVLLRTIKQCPRCTVPCRDQTTGKFLFSDEKLKLWNVLKREFPLKFKDPEWGSWAGAYFGVYMGYDAKNKIRSTDATEMVVLHVGDTIVPRDIVPWDAHLKTRHPHLVWLLLALIIPVMGVLIHLKTISF